MGIEHYTQPSPDGYGVEINIEQMAVDIITATKATGHTIDQLFSMLTVMWPEVQVKVTIPKEKMQ